MGKTKIEWATHTMNDQAGCTKMSPACTHCYALTLSVRIGKMGRSARYQGVTNGDMKSPKWSGVINADLEARERNFREIRNSRKPRRTFYGSMTDIWHGDMDINGPELSALAEEVAKLDQCQCTQVVMFLTKRPDRLLEWQQTYFPDGLPEQVWVGSTVENQKLANERMPLLTKIKAKVRYLSCEPLLGGVKLQKKWLKNLEWVIVGGESGNKARPSKASWIRSLRDQSSDADIPFHFKQWGEHEEHGQRIGKKKAGRELDGRTWDGLPTYL